MPFVFSNQHLMWDQINGKDVFSLYHKKHFFKKFNNISKSRYFKCKNRNIYYLNQFLPLVSLITSPLRSILISMSLLPLHVVKSS